MILIPESGLEVLPIGQEPGGVLAPVGLGDFFRWWLMTADDPLTACG